MGYSNDRPGISRNMAPGLCPHACSLAQPNLLIIPLSNGVNGHISPQDWKEKEAVVRERDSGVEEIQRHAV